MTSRQAPGFDGGCARELFVRIHIVQNRREEQYVLGLRTSYIGLKNLVVHRDFLPGDVRTVRTPSVMSFTYCRIFHFSQKKNIILYS